MGFDGITHLGGGRVQSGSVRHRVYIAFEPEQVKSATGNSGAFDGANPDIRFSRSAPKPQDFVPSPNGGLDYGEVTPEMGRAMRRQAGAIRLQQGVQNADGSGYGLAHIEANHGKQIRSAGFVSVPAFVAHIAGNFNELLQASKGSQLLVAVSTGRRDVMFVQMEATEDEDFYRVNTAFPASRDYLEKQERKGAKVIWNGSEPRSTATGQQPPYAGNPELVSGQDAPIARGQNSVGDGSEPTSAVAGQQPAFATAASASPEAKSSQGSSNARGQEASVPPQTPDAKFSRSPGKAQQAKAQARDAEHLSAVEQGDMATAQRLVNEAAAEAGYVGSDYRMQHEAPSAKNDGVRLDELRGNGIVPDDYWTHPQWYVNGPEEAAAHRAVVAAMRSADARKAAGEGAGAALMTVHRAIPKNAKDGTIRNGDWVSPSLAYAKMEGESIPDGYRIISRPASIKSLYWDGNSVAEFGYDDGQNYGYKNTKNNAKLLDAVTRDDGGAVIPLSQRFNARKEDVRFSRSPATKAAYEARIDALFAGERPSPQGVRVLDRSDMLALLGMGAGPVHVVEGKVEQGLFNHGLTAGDWKKVPEWLDNPAAVFDSDTQPGRLVFIAPELVRGSSVRMIVDPRPDGQGVNLLINAYDAERNPFQRWEREGLLRYFDQQKAPTITGSFQPRLTGLPGDKGRSKILTQKHLAGWRRASNPAFSFAGEKAATANTMALGVAQERLEAGEDAEAVRQDTGWHKAADGKWRFEISDADAVLKDRSQWTVALDGAKAKRDTALRNQFAAEDARNAFLRSRGESPSRISAGTRTEPEFKDLAKALKAAAAAADKAQAAAFAAEQGGSLITVGDVLDHPALFAAYPGIAGVRVDINHGLPANHAAYTYETRAIELSGKSNPEEVLSTLLHEIQHGIQHIEGFAMGGTPKDMAGALDRDALEKMALVDDLLTAEFEALQSKWGSVDAQSIPANVAERATVLRREINAIRATGHRQISNPFVRPTYTDAELHDGYRRLAGEVEARNTQTRQTLTTDERRATPPSQTADVSDSNVIVVFNGKEMQSAPAPANAPKPQPVPRQFQPLANQSAAKALNDTLVQYGLGQDWSRAYEAVKLPDALFGIRDAFQAAFGRDVRSVAPTAAKFNIFNGIYIPSRPGDVFVNAASDVGFVHIAGHELWHAIKMQRPDLIEWYQTHSRQYYKDLPAYRDRLNALVQDSEKQYDAQSAEEELEADFMGDALADPAFLQQLADASPSKFRALLGHVRLWLASVANKLNIKGLGSSKEVTDVRVLQG